MSAAASARIRAEVIAKSRPSALEMSNGEEVASRFNPLPVLLHELNQPLTGLQCSLELATVGERTLEEYRSALRQGLDLVARMRMLVEAVREIADIEQEESSRPEVIALDCLVRSTVDDLRPVAESREIHIDVDGNSFPHSCLAQRSVTATLFRIVDSILSLAASDSVVRVHLHPLDRQAAVAISWMVEKTTGETIEKTAESAETAGLRLSPPDVGLLVARTCWESAGGRWITKIAPANYSLTLLLPWAENDNLPQTSSCGDRS
jgi:hypothetical protein